MAARVPRLLIIAVIGMLAVAGLALAAGGSLVRTSSPPASTQQLPQQLAVLVVPDVTKQPFVFAKETIQESGLAWKVVGKVRGFPSNTVVSQTPAAGTKVYDTGAPLVRLQLEVNKKYPQKGTPEDISPYPATAIELAEAPTVPAGGATTSAAPAAAPTTVASASTTAHTTTAPAPAATTTAPPATTTAPAAAPSRSPLAKSTKTASRSTKTARYPQVRPPAFTVAGAPAEPLDEMPLVDRAKTLDRWLTQHPKPTNATVKYWLYQNEWIVTGARFGWWHGAQALRVLIRVDRRTQALWGIGAKSEAVAAGALTEVEARSK